MVQECDRPRLARRLPKVCQTSGNRKCSSDTKIFVHMVCQTTTNKMAISAKFPCRCTMREILTWWAMENALNPDIVTMTQEGEVVSMKDTLGQVQKKAKVSLKKSGAESVRVVLQPGDGRAALTFRPEDFLTEELGVHNSCVEGKQHIDVGFNDESQGAFVGGGQSE